MALTDLGPCPSCGCADTPRNRRAVKFPTSLFRDANQHLFCSACGAYADHLDVAAKDGEAERIEDGRRRYHALFPFGKGDSKV